MRALREGSATLNVTATNRHGQKLSDTLTLTAGVPTGVDVEIVRYVQLKTSAERKSGCDGKRNPARLWFAAGQPFDLVYRLLGAGSPLVNAPLGIRMSAKPGVTQVSYEELTWQGTVIRARRAVRARVQVRCERNMHGKRLRLCHVIAIGERPRPPG